MAVDNPLYGRKGWGISAYPHGGYPSLRFGTHPVTGMVHFDEVGKRAVVVCPQSEFGRVASHWKEESGRLLTLPDDLAVESGRGVTTLRVSWNRRVDIIPMAPERWRRALDILDSDWSFESYRQVALEIQSGQIFPVSLPPQDPAKLRFASALPDSFPPIFRKAPLCLDLDTLRERLRGDELKSVSAYVPTNRYVGALMMLEHQERQPNALDYFVQLAEGILDIINTAATDQTEAIAYVGPPTQPLQLGVEATLAALSKSPDLRVKRLATGVQQTPVCTVDRKAAAADTWDEGLVTVAEGLVDLVRTPQAVLLVDEKLRSDGSLDCLAAMVQASFPGAVVSRMAALEWLTFGLSSQGPAQKPESGTSTHEARRQLTWLAETITECVSYQRPFTREVGPYYVGL